nr:family 1 glycosylhydrolase [uncultured Mediterraneibacter sp.]
MTEQLVYQAAHHQLLASAKVVALAHDIDPENKMGCMLAAGNVYPYSCDPKDVWTAFRQEHESYTFLDVQIKGRYPYYLKNQLEEKGIHIQTKPEDDEILANGTVDYLALSYYSTRVAGAEGKHPQGEGNAVETATLAQGCEGVTILGQGDINAALLDLWADMGVKYLSTRTIGFNHIDLAHAAQRGIKVCNASYPPSGVADFTLMLMLMCLRNYKQALWRGYHQLCPWGAGGCGCSYQRN